MIMFFEDKGRKKNWRFLLKILFGKKRGNKNDFKNTLCQVTRDSGQSCLNWQHKRRRKLVLGVNSDSMYMAIFLGRKNPLDYV